MYKGDLQAREELLLPEIILLPKIISLSLSLSKGRARLGPGCPYLPLVYEGWARVGQGPYLTLKGLGPQPENKKTIFFIIIFYFLYTTVEHR